MEEEGLGREIAFLKKKIQKLEKEIKNHIHSADTKDCETGKPEAEEQKSNDKLSLARNLYRKMGLTIFGHNNRISPYIVDYLLQKGNSSAVLKEIQMALEGKVGKAIPKATLYRHLNRLVDAEVLIQETLIRMEKNERGRREQRRATSIFRINPDKKDWIKILVPTKIT